MPKVRVIAVTKPVVDEIKTPDDLIAYTARVSNPNNQNNTETAPRLLKYLKDNNHWSPFEMAHVTMEINTTRDIARQMLRHRSFAFQEFSQRYADVKELEGMFEMRELRFQDDKNRQNSIEPDPKGNYRLNLQNWRRAQRTVIEYTKQAYESLLIEGVAKEVVRALLPEGLTKSRLYMSGSVRSWIHYCELRKGNGTQKEHRLIAEQCWECLLEHFPSFKEEQK